MSHRESDKVWHLFVTTQGGQVSVLQNMDAPTARAAYRSLDPRAQGWAQQGGSQNIGFGMWLIRDSGVKSLQIIGPEGEELFPRHAIPTREGGDAEQGSVHG